MHSHPVQMHCFSLEKTWKNLKIYWTSQILFGKLRFFRSNSRWKWWCWYHVEMANSISVSDLSYQCLRRACIPILLATLQFSCPGHVFQQGAIGVAFHTFRYCPCICNFQHFTQSLHLWISESLAKTIGQESISR